MPLNLFCLMHRMPACVTLATALVLLTGSANAVTPGFVGDFQDGTTQGWGAALQSLSVATDDGPLGAGDRFLEYSSTGGGGANSRMVIPSEFEDPRWTGDYLAAGVQALQADVSNLGSTPLNLRLALTNDSSHFASTDPVSIPAGGGWQTVVLPIDVASLTQIRGAESLDAVLGAVTEVRILSTVGLPDLGGAGARGDVIQASIGLDNVSLVVIPEPTSATLLALCLSIAAMRRR